MGGARKAGGKWTDALPVPLNYGFFAPLPVRPLAYSLPGSFAPGTVPCPLAAPPRKILITIKCQGVTYLR